MRCELLPHDGLLTLITDGAGANQETVRLIAEVTAHNDALVVFVFDPLEEKLPGIGRVNVAEGGQQIETDMSRRGLQTNFAAGFKERRQAVEGFSRRRAIPVMPLTTRAMLQINSANCSAAACKNARSWRSRGGGVMQDPADLSRLNDIVAPPPVPWWPPAPGWWLLGAALLAVIATLSWAALLHYRRNAYRRAALAEIDAIGKVNDPASAAALSAVLKRVALVPVSRALNVASLAAGLALTPETGPGRHPAIFPHGTAVGLAKAAFGAPIGDGDAVLAAARRWVTHHRAEA